MAVTPGVVRSDELCGLAVRVRKQMEEVCNEVKRIGFFRDRDREIEMRVGEILIFYMSNSIA